MHVINRQACFLIAIHMGVLHVLDYAGQCFLNFSHVHADIGFYNVCGLLRCCKKVLCKLSFLSLLYGQKNFFKSLVQIHVYRRFVWHRKLTIIYVATNTGSLLRSLLEDHSFRHKGQFSDSFYCSNESPIAWYCEAFKRYGQFTIQYITN